MIAYLAADLIWASKIKATADAIGVSARPTRTIEMFDARMKDSDVRGLIVDLEASAAVDLIRHARSAIVNQAAAGGADRDERISVRGVRVVAFGPHVAKELFQAARDAGADDVLPRGAMDRNMEEILLALEGRG